MNILSSFGVDFWKHLYNSPDQFAVFIATIALFVTTINVILVFIDWWSRFGIKLDCLFLTNTKQQGNTKKYDSFSVLINNLKSSNVCIIEISYITLDEANKLKKCQLFPSIKCQEIFLLSAHETKIIPADTFFSLKLFSTPIQKRLYIRIKTSRGLYFIDQRNLPWWKREIWPNKQFMKCEKQIEDDTK